MEGSHTYHDYKINVKKWKILDDYITPNEATISEMKTIIEKYGHHSSY